MEFHRTGGVLTQRRKDAKAINPCAFAPLRVGASLFIGSPDLKVME
jgi:hypothetical protein